MLNKGLSLSSAIAVLIELYGFTDAIARATVTGDVIPEKVATEMRQVFESADEDNVLIEYFKVAAQQITKRLERVRL
jgi:hypothetical protein